MKIAKFLRGAIAASTLMTFAGTTAVAQASPWSWATRAEHGVVDRVEHAAVGVASLALGVAGLGAAIPTAMAGMVGAMVSDSALGLILVGYAAPLVLAVGGAAAIGFGAYELYKSHEGLHLIRGAANGVEDGFNGARNAITSHVQVVDVFGDPILLPKDSSPATPNTGFRHSR